MGALESKLDLKQALTLARIRGMSEGRVLELVHEEFGTQPAPRRSRTYGEWKAARAAVGGASLATVGAEAGRVPAQSIHEIARRRGTPIRDYSDYRRIKLELEGGEAA